MVEGRGSAQPDSSMKRPKTHQIIQIQIVRSLLGFPSQERARGKGAANRGGFGASQWKMGEKSVNLDTGFSLRPL